MYCPAGSRGKLSPGNQCQDLLGERDDDPAGQGQESIRTLRRIMRLQRKADLHDAKTKQDQTDRPDKTEDEGGQIVDHRNRIALILIHNPPFQTNSDSTVIEAVFTDDIPFDQFLDCVLYHVL